jgi:hypothetical protein
VSIPEARVRIPGSRRVLTHDAHNPRMIGPRHVFPLIALAVTACSPSLNWRETRPENSGVRLTFPCKPSAQTRELALAGRPVSMQLHSCQAADATFALTVADMVDPTFVTPALRELRAAALRNLGPQAKGTAGPPFNVAGMTPNPEASRGIYAGSLPDGKAVQEQAAFFAVGTRVYQATVLGAMDAEAVDLFFESIKPIQ